MKNYVCTFAITVLSLMIASKADATLVSTNGSLSSAGIAASIIAAPADANDDGAFNSAIQAFDEIVGYTLLADLAVDGGTIGAGTRIDSHMIFLNSGPGNNNTLIEHGAGGSLNTATFTFDGSILGVMSASNGSQEVASSSFLGTVGTLYPALAFSARGLEGDPLDGLVNNDWYSFLDDTISLGLRVTEPGDWLRVVTVTAVPLPAALPLFAGGLGLMGLMGWRRKRKATA